MIPVIVNKIPAYNFSGNIPDMVVANVLGVVSFVLRCGAKTIVSETYTASEGTVTIRLRNILEHAVKCPSLSELELPIIKYDYNVAGIEGSFYCLKGGHGADVVAEEYVKTNFLSWQPQTRRTLYHTPHYLRYAALLACRCKAKGYFPDQSTQIVDLLVGMVAGNTYTICTTYGDIRGKFSQQPTYIDVWIEAGGARQTWVQRYVLEVDEDHGSDFFVFENSLGGFDTIRFGGDRTEINKHEPLLAVFDEDTVEYDIDRTKSYKKYTGYFPDENTRLWALDFFNSTNRFHLHDGVLHRIYVSEPKLESTRDALGGYEFTFAWSRQAKYLNLPRIELPSTLEITDPAAELFFLEPRLNQFPRASLGKAEVLIPVQYANSEKWHVISADSITGGGMDESQLADYLTIHKYATHEWVKDGFLPLNLFDEIFSVSEKGALLCKLPLYAMEGFITGSPGTDPAPGGSGGGGYLSEVTGSGNGLLSFLQTNHDVISVDLRHTHPASEVAGLEGVYAKKTDIPAVPTSFPWESVTGKPALYPSDWTVVSGKPTFYSTLWSMVSGRPSALSQFTDDVVAGNYLGLSGGVMSGSVGLNNTFGMWNTIKEIRNSALYINSPILSNDAYTSLIGIKSAGGNTISFGAVNDGVGFWGFRSDNTGTAPDHSFYCDTNTGVWHFSQMPTLGAFPAMCAKKVDGYYGFALPDGSDFDWIRMTSTGLLPYSPGGASNIGHPGWPFLAAYITDIYGTLHGNLDGTWNGYDTSSFMGNYSYTIDATGLDQSTYYPVTVPIGPSSMVRISVIVALNSESTPSWSTHAAGFSCRFVEEVNGAGWGINPVNRTILANDYAFALYPPIGRVAQMTTSSTEVIWVRGGGRYYLWMSHPYEPVLRTQAYTINSQIVEPISFYEDLWAPATGGGVSTPIVRCQEVRLTGGARIFGNADGSVEITDSTGANSVLVTSADTKFRKGFTQI